MNVMTIAVLLLEGETPPDAAQKKKRIMSNQGSYLRKARLPQSLTMPLFAFASSCASLRHVGGVEL
jgi:hypothetical protein